jgi:hypothetical protein
MWRTCYCLIVCLGFFCVRAACFADQIVFQHSGANDPTTEGWAAGTPPSAVPGVGGPVINDQNTGIDAWSVSFPSGGFLGYYKYSPSTQELNDAFTYGWTFTVNMRFAVLPNQEFFYFNVDLPKTSRGGSTADYGFIFFSDNGNLDLLQENTTNTIQIQNPTAYHLYQLKFDPISKSADLLIDGNLTETNLPTGGSGNTDWGGGVGEFGNSGPDAGQANFNLVQFDIVPEPSTLALLALGSLGLLVRRKFAR